MVYKSFYNRKSTYYFYKTSRNNGYYSNYNGRICTNYDYYFINLLIGKSSFVVDKGEFLNILKNLYLF